MSLLDVLLGVTSPKKTFTGTSSPSPPSSPVSLSGEAGVDGDDTWQKVLRSIVPDPYAERMQAALRKINSPAYPAGMIQWLKKAEPELYKSLTERLPDEIQRLWEAHAPLEQFEEALARLVSQHRRASAIIQPISQSEMGTTCADRKLLSATSRSTACQPRTEAGRKLVLNLESGGCKGHNEQD